VEWEGSDTYVYAREVERKEQKGRKSETVFEASYI
jgi:hypothetical protein